MGFLGASAKNFWGKLHGFVLHTSSDCPGKTLPGFAWIQYQKRDLPIVDGTDVAAFCPENGNRECWREAGSLCDETN
jgi:hypothetical protein